MARYRLSRSAEADLAHILAISGERWGAKARRRYAALLAVAMRNVAAEPNGPATCDRAELSPGIRSFYVRHARGDDPKVKVRQPLHVLYYHAVEPVLIEIVRVLHEHMEPSRHLGAISEDSR